MVGSLPPNILDMNSVNCMMYLHEYNINLCVIDSLLYGLLAIYSLF